MIVYKRIRNIHGRLTSAFVSIWPVTEWLTVNYKVGKAVSAPVGKLFAFDTEKHANAFYFGAETWKAEATGAKRSYRKSEGFAPSIAKNVKAFWKGKYKCGDMVSASSPKGTVLCDTITLLERVH